jgi:diaminopimelate epimerase
MNFTFYKYQGTGNDFILIDNRRNLFKADRETIAQLCHRRFGIGADGLILLENEPSFDFKMVYFNSDGNPSSMCGNGGRCIVAFAKFLGLAGRICRFLAVDGEHLASIDGDNVSLKMKDVSDVEKGDGFYYLDTGSPHYVKLVSDIEKMDVFRDGRAVRYNDRFKEVGTNVNFLQNFGDHIFVRTYERGVEDETYSCGTGVTAAGLVASLEGIAQGGDCTVKTIGGDLKVSFKKQDETSFRDIWLTGPALQVFKGEINVGN